MSALPGVQHAAFAWGVPLTGNNWPASVEIEGPPPAVKPSDRIPLPLRSVTPDYFKLLGLRDRRWTRLPFDRCAQRAASRRHQPGSGGSLFCPRSSAIGKKLWLRGRERPANGNHRRRDEWPHRRSDAGGRARDLSFALAGGRVFETSRASGRRPIRVRSLAPCKESCARSIRPSRSKTSRRWKQIRGDSLASRTFAMQLLVGFALVGSVLTLVGIYGVLSLSVASRRRESPSAARSAPGRATFGSLFSAKDSA